jgi:hypothetical protein
MHGLTELAIVEEILAKGVAIMLAVLVKDLFRQNMVRR